jgi:hypothetical protein
MGHDDGASTFQGTYCFTRSLLKEDNLRFELLLRQLESFSRSVSSVLLESSVCPTAPIASLPRNVWGKATINAGSWGVSLCGKVDAKERSSTGLELDVDNQAADLTLRLTASAGSGFNVRGVGEATKGLNIDGAHVTISPR